MRLTCGAGAYEWWVCAPADPQRWHHWMRARDTKQRSGNHGIARDFTQVNAYMEVGFNLTCTNNYTTNTTHARLFLSDSNIERISSVHLPISLYVTSCSATATLVDALTNITMDVCSTISSTNNVSSENGYCSLDSYNWKNNNLTSLAIQLTRLDQPDLHLINTSSINVVMYEIFTYNGTIEELQQAIRRGDKTGLTASLAWYMKDDYRTCKEAKKNNKTYACMSQNSDCYDALSGTNWASLDDTIGYVCQCIKGYHDIDECALPERYTCNGTCTNTKGNFNCTCPPGTLGDPKHGVCINIPGKNKTLLLASSTTLLGGRGIIDAASLV
ncbi:wall-associated receptor kinase 2-like [Canna indica]|uniref:Wall-associated receptor kinase 2-like n=1 Tax=Canna indica TaxID=4628 RepID=A0AAQ3JYR2_9LILI|nr:wall-associated receptor kinase 2-like [Canna indica]